MPQARTPQTRRRWMTVAAAAISVQQSWLLSATTEALERRQLHTTFYVDTNNPAASDNNPGTSINAPLKTIDQALTLSQNNNATSQSDTIYIRAGIYHEQPNVLLSNSGFSATDRTLISAYINPATNTYEPVYIDAADTTTGTWTRDGTTNRWYLDNFTTQTSGVWVDFSANNDNAGLQQIGGYAGESAATRKVVGSQLSDMTPGSYFADTTTNRLYVWLADNSDPNTHTIEYANRARAIYQPGTPINDTSYAYASHLDFKGLKLRHDNVYNTDGQDTGCAIYTANDQRLIDCDIQYNAGVGVFLRDSSQLINCTVSNNGGNGVAAQGNGFLLNGGHYNSNYWRQYNTGSAAGIKVITNTPTIYGDIQNIECAGNFGQGIWYDSCFENSIVSHITGNYIHDNQQDGIDLEASRNYLVSNNVITNNLGDGIAINATENASIYNNTIVGNYGVAAIELDGGTRDQGPTYPGITGTINTAIRNNIIANNYTVYDLDIPTSVTNNPEVANNTSDYNLFYRRGDSLHFTTGGTYVGWARTPSTLADWQTISGQDAHSIVADPLFVSGNTGPGAYNLGSNSPAKDAGLSLPTTVTTDYAQTPRPQFAGYDIGAFEYASGGPGTAGTIITNTNPTVWVDDQLPPNAAMTAPDETGNTGQNRFWQWNTTTVYSGAAALDSTLITGPHRQYFSGADPRSVAATDDLFAYVYLDPINPPREIMLEWQDAQGSWNHLAYWGDNLITNAIDGSNTLHNMGPLPTTGQWTRLQIPASTVGMAGSKITGFSFDLYDGRALTDKIGNGPATASLHGILFQDNNGNGYIDPNEPVLANNTIYLDLNNDNTLDPGDPSTTTDSNGAYSFSGLSPGNYLVRQIVPNGFIASTFNGSAAFLSLAADTTTEKDFGLFPTTFAPTENGDIFTLSQSFDVSTVNISQYDPLTGISIYSISTALLPSIDFELANFHTSFSIDTNNGLPAFTIEGTGNNTLDLTGGNLTLTPDSSLLAANLTLNVDNNASLTFLNDQPFARITDFQLAGLNIAAGASAVVSQTVLNYYQSLLVVSAFNCDGTLDLNNNDMVIRNGDITSISALLGAGFNAGQWNGSTGILSTTASNDAQHLTAIGSATGLEGYFDNQTITSNDIALKFTAYGDTNLDGTVDGSDYSRLDSATLTAATGWFNGDFNYDGVVDGSDYTLIDNAFNNQSAIHTTTLSAHRVDPATVAILSSSSYLTTDPILLTSQSPISLAVTTDSELILKHRKHHHAAPLLPYTLLPNSL